MYMYLESTCTHCLEEYAYMRYPSAFDMSELIIGLYLEIVSQRVCVNVEIKLIRTEKLWIASWQSSKSL